MTCEIWKHHICFGVLNPCNAGNWAEFRLAINLSSPISTSQCAYWIVKQCFRWWLFASNDTDQLQLSSHGEERISIYGHCLLPVPCPRREFSIVSMLETMECLHWLHLCLLRFKYVNVCGFACLRSNSQKQCFTKGPDSFQVVCVV